VKGGLAASPGEGRVDDVPHAGVGRRHHEAAVVLAPSLGLVGRHHKEHVDVLERPRRERMVAVLRLAHLAAGDGRHLLQVAHHQNGGEVGQVPGDQATEGSGGAGDGDRG